MVSKREQIFTPFYMGQPIIQLEAPTNLLCVHPRSHKMSTSLGCLFDLGCAILASADDSSNK